MRSVLEGANALRLAERNEQAKVKAKLKQHQDEQLHQFNGFSKDAALYRRHLTHDVCVCVLVLAHVCACVSPCTVH